VGRVYPIGIPRFTEPHRSLVLKYCLELVGRLEPGNQRRRGKEVGRER